MISKQAQAMTDQVLQPNKRHVVFDGSLCVDFLPSQRGYSRGSRVARPECAGGGAVAGARQFPGIMCRMETAKTRARQREHQDRERCAGQPSVCRTIADAGGARRDPFGRERLDLNPNR